MSPEKFSRLRKLLLESIRSFHVMLSASQNKISFLFGAWGVRRKNAVRVYLKPRGKTEKGEKEDKIKVKKTTCLTPNKTSYSFY